MTENELNYDADIIMKDIGEKISGGYTSGMGSPVDWWIDNPSRIKPKVIFRCSDCDCNDQEAEDCKVIEESNNILSFEESTNTIRQLPQNYLIASKTAFNNGSDRWIVDFDSAADIKLVVRVVRALKNHKNRYGSGFELLAAVTPNEK